MGKHDDAVLGFGIASAVGVVIAAVMWWRIQRDVLLLRRGVCVLGEIVRAVGNPGSDWHTVRYAYDGRVSELGCKLRRHRLLDLGTRVKVYVDPVSGRTEPELTLLRAGGDLRHTAFMVLGGLLAGLLWALEWPVWASIAVGVVGYVLSVPWGRLYSDRWVLNNRRHGLPVDLSAQARVGLASAAVPAASSAAAAGAGAPPTASAPAFAGVGIAAGGTGSQAPAVDAVAEEAASGRTYSQLLDAIGHSTQEDDVIAAMRELHEYMLRPGAVASVGGVSGFTSAVQAERERALSAGRYTWSAAIATEFRGVVEVVRSGAGNGGTSMFDSLVPSWAPRGTNSNPAPSRPAATDSQVVMRTSPLVETGRANSSKMKSGGDTAAAPAPAPPAFITTTPAAPIKRTAFPYRVFLFLLGINVWPFVVGLVEGDCSQPLSTWAVVTGSVGLWNLGHTLAGFFAHRRLTESLAARVVVATSVVQTVSVFLFGLAWMIVGAVWRSKTSKSRCDGKLILVTNLFSNMRITVSGILFLTLMCVCCANLHKSGRCCGARRSPASTATSASAV